jgi:hypothetical protein
MPPRFLEDVLDARSTIVAIVAGDVDLADTLRTDRVWTPCLHHTFSKEEE